MKKTLLERFKEEYESASDFRVIASDFDIKGNLIVFVKNKYTNSEMWLRVREKENGEIIWW